MKLILIPFSILWIFFITAVNAADNNILVQSTTSTKNSGFYDYILPKFQAETGIGPVYLNGRPQTRDEQREALEEDGRMTPAEIEEWLDSLEM